MSKAEQDLLRFLRQQTCDGLLTGEDVWMLADYLNNHKDARDTAPGRILMPALRRAFEDGVLTKDEMLELAALVCHIEQEAALAMPREVASPMVKEPPPLPAAKLNPKLLLPTFQWRGQVSSSDGSTLYEVDLLNQTCTCPD